MRTMKTVLAAAVLGSSALVLSACGDASSKTPEEVTIEFSNAFFAGDHAKIMKMVDTRKVKDNDLKTIEGKLKVMVEANKKIVDAKGGYEKSEVTKIDGNCKEVKNEVCTITVKQYFGDGSNQDGSLKLVNVGGELKVFLGK